MQIKISNWKIKLPEHIWSWNQSHSLLNRSGAGARASKNFSAPGPWQIGGPTYSPDLNPVENLWDALFSAQCRDLLPPFTFRGLETVLQQKLRLLSSSAVDHLVTNMITGCTLKMHIRELTNPIDVRFCCLFCKHNFVNDSNRTQSYNLWKFNACLIFACNSLFCFMNKY